MDAPVKKTPRREQIQSAAVALFREKGYNATSMRQLAETIGMEAASLYNHINSKEDLLKEICFSTASAYLQQLEKVEKSGKDALRQVELVTRFQVRMMLDEFERVYVSQRDWKHLKEPFLKDFLQQRRDYEKRFSAIIESGIQAGQFKKLNTYVAVLSILSAVRGVEHWHRHPKGVSARQLENDLVELLVGGLRM